MKDLVSLFEDGERCGYCQEFWQNCKCRELFGDDYWGDYNTPEYREQQQASAWELIKRWSY